MVPAASVCNGSNNLHQWARSLVGVTLLFELLPHPTRIGAYDGHATSVTAPALDWPSHTSTSSRAFSRRRQVYVFIVMVPAAWDNNSSTRLDYVLQYELRYP